MLCEYKNILGEPGKGFHETRLFGMAAYDLIGTLIIIVLISLYFEYSLVVVFIFVSILTILLHRVFCVNTTINKAIFGEINL
jgi:hypothetical protein